MFWHPMVVATAKHAILPHEEPFESPDPTTNKSLMNVVLYLRRGCHLCDDAHTVLVEHGLAPGTIDVDDDPALKEKFGECVPVVEIDGKIRFRGCVDAVLLRRLLVGGGER